jgi:hypothetical protein
MQQQQHQGHVHYVSPYASVKPYPRFNATTDSEGLNKAFKEKGDTKAQHTIEILCRRSNAQRQQIRHQYKQLYGDDLIEKLVHELKGHLEDVMVALMNTPAEYDARELHHAMQGVGTTESTLIEILSTRSNHDLREIKQAYRAMYHKDLEKAIADDTSGRFKRFLVTLCSANREENLVVDRQRARKSAQDLLNAGIANFGTEDSVFNVILGNQSYPQLEAIFEEYRSLTGHNIYQAIEKEFKGDIKDALLAIFKSVVNTPLYFAETAYYAMKGVGTNDRKLIRVIVTRAEKDMVLIKREFQEVFKKSLESWIKDDTSGKYRDALIALVQGN